MIAIATENGALVKSLPFLDEEGETFGFHPRFGWIPEFTLASREHSRKRRGLRGGDENWECRFKLSSGASSMAVEPVEGCKAERQEDGSWRLETLKGIFLLAPAATAPVLRATADEEDKDHTGWILLLLTLFTLVGVSLLPTPKIDVAAVEEVAPVTIQMLPEKAVVVPKLHTEALPKEIVKAVPKQEVRRAIQQNLGFLGLLGKKELTKALGGMPTALKDASAGAGAGGKEGSGGELLVGLGAGVKRTTVGNSGVAGLGGIGTKGAGGGAGGYGNSMVGSGEGKGLSTVPLSQDMVLEGGLDRSVIQATIAKYLSQVRACYEDGLRNSPGLTGTVTMAFEILGAGSVQSPRVARTSLGNPGVEGCISRSMMNWKFPKPLGGVTVKVAYPFLLRPVSS